MTRGKRLAAICVTALALGASPAWAQRGSAERADPDSRPTGPDRTGTAVDRPSSSPAPSSSAPSSGGGGGAGASSGGSSSSPSGGGYSAPAATAPSSSSTSQYVSAPVRPSRGADREYAQGRTPSGGGGGRQPSSGGGGRQPSGDAGGGSARAVPRGSDTSTPSSGGGSRSASAPADDRNADAPSRRAVPTYSRPRDNRPVTGTAVDRPAGYYGGGGNTSVIYYPSYPYYGGYYPGYAFGLGLGFYDAGWYDPYYYGGYYGGGYGPGYYGGGYGGGYQGGYGSISYGHGPTGSLRLKIKPREGQVYVDGYFVGVVDDFDGTFQKLGIDAGGHRIEIKAPGHEPISFDVVITPNETVTYKGELRRIQ